MNVRLDPGGMIMSNWRQKTILVEILLKLKLYKPHSDYGPLSVDSTGALRVITT